MKLADLATGSDWIVWIAVSYTHLVERWIDTPKDVPFSYARSIWNQKDINREEYQALLEEIRSYPIAPINNFYGLWKMIFQMQK